MYKTTDRCEVVSILGLREVIYGNDNHVLGFWELGTGIRIFSDSIDEYELCVKIHNQIIKDREA